LFDKPFVGIEVEKQGQFDILKAMHRDTFV